MNKFCNVFCPWQSPIDQQNFFCFSVVERTIPFVFRMSPQKIGRDWMTKNLTWKTRSTHLLSISSSYYLVFLSVSSDKKKQWCRQRCMMGFERQLKNKKLLLHVHSVSMRKKKVLFGCFNLRLWQKTLNINVLPNKLGQFGSISKNVFFELLKKLNKTNSHFWTRWLFKNL